MTAPLCGAKYADNSPQEDARARTRLQLQADAKSVVLFNDGMVTNRLFVYGDSIAD